MRIRAFESLRFVIRSLNVTSTMVYAEVGQHRGYTGEQMTWHGFRAMASMMLNEKGSPPDVIELAFEKRWRPLTAPPLQRLRRFPPPTDAHRRARPQECDRSWVCCARTATARAAPRPQPR